MSLCSYIRQLTLWLQIRKPLSRKTEKDLSEELPQEGIIQLVLTITVIGIFVSGPWALIDFIMLIMRSGSYATDAQGQPLQ